MLVVDANCKGSVMKGWTIRTATPEDAGGLHACMERAYSGYLERMGDRRLPPMDVDYDDEIRNYPVWVAVSEGNVVGGIILMFEAQYTSIANIVVDPPFQGNGLGGGLMKHAEAMAAQRGYRELRLATHVLLTENVDLPRLSEHLKLTNSARDNP